MVDPGTRLVDVFDDADSSLIGVGHVVASFKPQHVIQIRTFKFESQSRRFKSFLITPSLIKITSAIFESDRCRFKCI